MPKTFTDANFGTAVLASKLPVLVDFWAPWCGPCKMLTPVLAALEAEYADRLVIGKLDIDENQQTADAYHVTSIPYLVVFIGGKPVAGIEGAVPRKPLAAMIDKALATHATKSAKALTGTRKPKKSTTPARKKSK